MGLLITCTANHVISLFQALLIFFFSCFCLQACTAIDTITLAQPIKDPETIISDGTEAFKLGFFSPVNSSNRYVGIWFNNVSVMTVVWVANRDKPLINDSSGTVAIWEDGNLVVLDGQDQIIWSSNVSNPVANSSARLLDSGDLVLRDDSNGGRIIWESFQHHSDSFLTGMRISTDANTGEKSLLTSWKSPSDPSIGSFSAGIGDLRLPEIIIWNGSHPYWRSGPWNSQIFLGIPGMDSMYLNGFNVVDDREGNVYMAFSYANQSIITYLVLNSQGTLVQKYWYDGMEDWEIQWLAPETECDVYGKCGPFGSCNSHDSPICTCLGGFEPKNIEEWNSRNFTSGCVRRTPLQCERNSTSSSKEDGFLKLKKMKVPDFAEWYAALEDECESQCSKNCFCVAYAYYTGIGCMLWTRSLIDVQKFSSDGADLYIRVAYSELDKKQNMKVIMAVTVILGSLTTAICIYFLRRWIAKQRGRKKKGKMLLSKGGEMESYESMLWDSMAQVKLEELPLFNFEMLTIATDNFHSANKLGQGGFGPVYRGKLPNEQEIAVKRLSRASEQGLEEFMNEVVVISKLQHRNLVRLLGCCTEGEEKMLIYEYMPNKSLDAFLFDPLQQGILDWRKRFNIIEGIGRGLLYLHRDSRLRIIHRDLKPSNILLDEELNPKISDFGMARIFGGNQDQANTRRVVGTYGYMAPEYAMEGRFSEKSDVFSFGVLLLEIVSGRRNTSFYNDERSLSLLGFGWKLWNEDKIIMLIDPTISKPCFQMEILRCIHVGLLCVQEFAKDRPNVSTVLSMLSREIAHLPSPKPPAFTDRHIPSHKESSHQNQKRCSINTVTITIIEGR